jgi:vacuolar-type H+-ATPase subunit I/STV1
MAKKLMRFRVKEGKHHTGNKKNNNYKMYKKGDIIETTQDLIKVLGREKFERLEDKPGSKVAVEHEVVQSTEEEEDKDADNQNDEENDTGEKSFAEQVNDLTVAQLEEFAAENDVDLSGTNLKQEKVDRILAAFSDSSFT